MSSTEEKEPSVDLNAILKAMRTLEAATDIINGKKDSAVEYLFDTPKSEEQRKGLREEFSRIVREAVELGKILKDDLVELKKK